MLAVLPRVPTSTNLEQQLSSTLKSQRAMTSESEPVIKSTDMAEELQFDAIRVARQVAFGAATLGHICRVRVVTRQVMIFAMAVVPKG